VAVPGTERLDRFLADQLAVSRTQASRLIGTKAVRVNGQPGRAGRALKHADTVEVRFAPDERPRTLVPHPITLDVVYEDDAMLVLDKPAGLVVHPAPGHWDDTLLNALVARGTRLSGGGSGRPGIVHRLDRDTSGLMIVAKQEVAHRRLSRAIGARKVERHYAALVWGHIRAPVEIEGAIARHPTDRKRMAVVATGRAAQTTVEPLARFAVCDLVRVRLATGRTHQIRVHLAHIGHPVVGDAVYGGGGSRRITGSDRPLAETIERATPRHALHAARLGLIHPVSGVPMVLRSEWPPDLQAALGCASGDASLLARPNPLEYLGFFE